MTAITRCRRKTTASFLRLLQWEEDPAGKPVLGHPDRPERHPLPEYILGGTGPHVWPHVPRSEQRLCNTP